MQAAGALGGREISICCASKMLFKICRSRMDCASTTKLVSRAASLGDNRPSHDHTAPDPVASCGRIFSVCTRVSTVVTVAACPELIVACKLPSAMGAYKHATFNRPRRLLLSISE